MNFKRLKPTLFKLHRWIGIGLAPLFLLIALSGAVLAFKPIVQQSVPDSLNAAPAAQVIKLLERIDPEGDEVDAISIDMATNQADVRSQDPQIAGRYDLSSGVCACGNDAPIRFNLFEFAEHLHKELLFGADILIQIASYLMILMMLMALLLPWPRLRNNLMGWHRGVGWFLLPMVLILPLTGVLMSLHVGMPELPRMSQPDSRLPLADVLSRAQQTQGLDSLNMVRRFRGGSVLVSTYDKGEKQLLILTDHSVTPINPQENLVKTLHEGTWAGPLSGTINLLGASALSLLILSGSISWLKRRRRMRERALLTSA
ncbi:MAG: PepSY-associated TM helix domain-containing protein [Candidatus Thiodiazotropha sp.]